MNRFESKYFATAEKMDEAFLKLLDQKEFEYITVKEICSQAGVNRSTFYLHYETINDLLLETSEYISKKFSSYFKGEIGQHPDPKVADLEQLKFITEEYLIPWLTFIKENKRLFQTFIKRHEILGMEDMYKKFFKQIIQPILARFQVKIENQEYMFAFYVEGIIAIVKIWIQDDCRRPIEDIIEIIKGCVRSHES